MDGYIRVEDMNERRKSVDVFFFVKCQFKNRLLIFIVKSTKYHNIFHISNVHPTLFTPHTTPKYRLFHFNIQNIRDRLNYLILIQIPNEI